LIASTLVESRYLNTDMRKTE